MTKEFYIRCSHCNTVDFDGRFALRFYDHVCCTYNGPEQPVKKWKQLRFWTITTGEDTELMRNVTRNVTKFGQ